MSRARTGFLASVFIGLVGCGGGGGTSGPVVRPRIDIVWGERARTFVGPSSALSATVTFTGAQAGGQDLTFVVERPEGAQPPTQTYVAPSPVGVGPMTFRIEFHAETGGRGAVVGTASVSGSVLKDGTLADASGTPLNTVATTGTIKSLLFPPGQHIEAGITKLLVLTPLDGQGRAVAVTPGSFRIECATDGIRANEDGTVTGQFPGRHQVVATIDGVSQSDIVIVDATSLPGVRPLDVLTTDYAYNPATHRIVATVKADGGAYANRIVEIDPESGQVVRSAPAGGEPGPIAISADGQVVYFALTGAIGRYDVPSGTVTGTFDLGSRPFYGVLTASDIAVSPVDPNVVAVSLKDPSVIPSHAGVAVYDEGVRRPDVTHGHIGSDRIEWATPEWIYGADIGSTYQGTYRLRVIWSGVTEVEDRQNGLGYTQDILYSDGRLYTTNGGVADAATLTPVGQFPLGLSRYAPVAVDAAAKRAYFVHHSGGGFVLSTYDTTTFALLGTRTLGISDRYPRNLTLAGPGRLALGSATGQVYILDLDNP